MNVDTASEKRRSFIDKFFTYVESRQASDRALFLLTLLIFIIALFYSLTALSTAHQQIIATEGGRFVEGIVGTPRFVNPVLAISRADQDIAALVYSGLLTVTPEGTLTPDLAESVTVSEDGLVYNIIIKERQYFHNGTPVTAEDVAYTIALIQDPVLKSPLRGNWNDVTVEILGDRELNLVLSEPYTPFMENLTVGILPKHIWGGLSVEQLPFSQHNTDPIGSGPYQLDRITYNKSGLIESYTLRAADRGDDSANISTIVLQFYQNEPSLMTALKEGALTATAGFSYDMLQEVAHDDRFTISTSTYPRVFTVFLNQNRSAVVRDAAVRKALRVALDRDELVQAALAGFGVPTDSPIPPGFIALESNATSTASTSTQSESRQRQAEIILLDAGWKQDANGSWQKKIDDTMTTLSLSIATANSPQFERTANYLAEVWGALGVTVDVQYFEQSDLVQNIMRPRNYDALLFGTELGRPLDFYPFWHSSQKDDPGLNVGLYANITTDKLLEVARTTRDENERISSIQKFVTEVDSETPAIFLYSPLFTYVIEKEVNASSFNRITRPSERFTDISHWYMSESSVWPMFAGN